MSAPDVARLLATGERPEGMSEDDHAAVLAAAGQLDVCTMLNLIADAQLAKWQLDAGDEAAARATVEPYRQMATDAGLGELYDHVVGSLFSKA